MTDSIQDAWPEAATFCWGCGKNNEHGLQLKSYWVDDETVATFTPQEHHLAFPGILNGGIIATIIDCHTTGTANAFAHRKIEDIREHEMYVTASLNVNYLKPTPMDKALTLKARVADYTDRSVRVACDLYSGKERCAEGEVVAVRVDGRRFLNAQA